MKPVFAHEDSLASKTLDVGHDDYYGHSGTWTDTQDSRLLFHLDASQDPAPEVADLTATSTTNFVRVGWGASTQQPGVTFRVYGDDGALVRDDATTTLTATGTVGQTLVWTVRAANQGGFLSAPATIRFKVGYGIVDDTGRLVRDTVPPARVQGLRAAKQGTKDVLLRWSAVSDPFRLKGYRITAPGARPVVVRAQSTHIAGRGKTIAVAAVDEAGNVGPATKIHVPR
jgi:hypothetical protein